jgi:hypothetical protein
MREQNSLFVSQEIVEIDIAMRCFGLEVRCWKQSAHPSIAHNFLKLTS